MLATLLSGERISVSQAEWAMSQFMRGEATGAQQGAFLAALAAKGVRGEDLVGFRDAILAEANPLELTSDALDIVGTGGDRFGTVNVSTMAAFVCAGAGVPIVKHGNRAASSKSGSSDVLSALGADLTLSASQLQAVFARVKVAFVHAARFLPGFSHVAAARKELGIPTVFNFLGPLCNPVRPEASAIGVADAARAPLIAEVFQIRGAAALVFRGDDGLDELSTTGHSHIWEVSRGAVTEHDLNPSDLGLSRAKLSDLVGGSPQENADTLRRVFAGEQGAVRDIVLLNAAAGMVAYDLYAQPESARTPLIERLNQRLSTASASIDNGDAERALDEWIKATNAAAQSA